ncbi:hypothetical protein O6P43_018152 [Quillaja saponaria]|uniref:Uncharacterized protein n=1 Tax=Quillaja saponaria TaxID=32244 RepID=A0AAD7LRX8_QUISA|nr:hypothetical protein O6P43_018152 [Quillaja saponaria]
METTKEQESGLLHKILPPSLEDAGLEDCALPPDSIKEAFLKAATAVKSQAASIFNSEDEAECVKDPGSGMPQTGAAVVIVGGGDGLGVEESEDRVVLGEGGKELGQGGKPCVDELQGLDIGEKVKNGNDEEEEEEKKGERPTLVEGFV